jgi:hypothetical protein
MFTKFPCFISTIFICLMILSMGCQKNEEDENIQKTFSSLNKMDPFPFYIMKYYNDYNFDEYLQTGNRPQTPAEVVAGSIDNYRACTCFSAGGGDTCYFGRNQDTGGRVTVALLVLTNPPWGYASASMVWTPCLGFDQNHLPDSPDFRDNLLLAPYFPTDGINENGVAIADMNVYSADPPYDPQKMTLFKPDIIRLVLDYATDTEHAISLISQYNVDLYTGGGEIPTHYLVADASGDSVIIEWIDNQMKIIRDDNPWQVSSNFAINGMNIPDQVTCWRYRNIYKALRECNGKLNAQKAMGILQSASFIETTWSCVYDLANLWVQVVINRNYQNVYSFSLQSKTTSPGRTHPPGP